MTHWGYNMKLTTLLVALLVTTGMLLGSIVTNALHVDCAPHKVIALHTDKGDQKIMNWVTQWMAPDDPETYRVPVVRRLVKRDIGIIYCGLAGEYCDKDVQKRIAGLFDHQTETVYVPDNMGKCQAIVSLAHEFVHYVQHYRDGSIAKVSESLREMVQDLREEEAYEIDDIFEKKFCK